MVGSVDHARIGYQAKEYAAYWHWLSVTFGAYLDPQNRDRDIAAMHQKPRGHGKHVAEEES
jgi:hypothetical protein